ncbi:MAG TPA: SRPBCC family protein [Actinomycetota bacterium]|nr:SRPBCC family protein [Actinomycetota bacterium]
MHIEVGEQINRPAHDVWDYIATNHVQNHPRWDPAIVKLEQKDSGPLGEGSRLEMVRKDSGPAMTMDVRMVEWDVDRKMAFEADAKQLNMTANMALEAVNPTTTTLNVTVDVEGKGVLKVMMPVMGGRMKKQIAAGLVRIKQALESK